MQKIRVIVLLCIVVGFMTGNGFSADWSAMISGTTNDLNGVWGSSGSDVFAVGDSGTILHYDGTAWAAVASPTINNLNSVWGGSGSDVFAVGDSGTILYYDGIAWAPMPSPTTNNLNDVWVISASDVFAVGDSGTILHYDGTAWAPVPSPTTNNLNSVWCYSASHGFAVGDSGTILHYDGIGWITMASPTTNNLNSVWCFSVPKAYAMGDDGTFLFYNGSWTVPMPPGTFTANLNAVWGPSGSDIFIIGDGGYIAYYAGSYPGGLMDSGTTENLTNVWGSSEVDVFTVGENGTILHYYIQPPANDDFDNATPITAVPFTDSINTRAATQAADDPTDCYGTNASVWYELTSITDIQIQVDTSYRDYYTVVAVYTGTRGNLNLITCSDYPCFTLDVQAGETYYFMVTSNYGMGGNLVFSVDVAPPPPPPLTIDLQVDPVNFVNNGITTVSGTVNSSAPLDYGYVQVQVRQKAGRVFITGYGYSYIYIEPVDGVARWTVQVSGDIGLFKAGKVTVRTIAQGCTYYDRCGGGECAQTPEVSTTVRLQNSKQ